MSKTEVRNGAIVEGALWTLARESEFAYGGRPYITVGQVARDAGCSYPTARKYLDILHQSGCAIQINLNGVLMYSPKEL